MLVLFVALLLIPLLSLFVRNKANLFSSNVSKKHSVETPEFFLT